MARIQWEYDLVERPFCQQLQAMGWQWLEGDVDVPELTERTSFCEVLLKERLAAALRRINLRDGKPWLDQVCIAKAIRDLEQAAGHRLMEINQAATALLLKGTEVDGLPDWDHGRNQPVRFIDFQNPANNDFLVINQFKVELTSGRGHVIPDVVLFVNGIPWVVARYQQFRAVHKAIARLEQEPSDSRALLDRSLPDWRARSEELRVRAAEIYWCGANME